MKITKRVLTIVLSLALIFGGISFVGPNIASADEDFAITAPKDASLKAAGYFDITWEDASVINEVDSYDVFVDGSLVKNTTDTKYEFYTTKVNFHKAWVRANFKDGTDHYTKTVRFGVTKKGIATEPNMGCWNIPTKDMGIAWYYNWGRGSYDYHPVYMNLEYVPMIWGTSDDQKIATIRNKMNSAISAGSKYMLGYNEPDIKHSGGSGIPNETVIALWPTFMSYSNRIHVASPAYAIWSDATGSTFPEFMAAVENNVDVVCLHCYPADWNGGKNMADWMLEKVVDDAYNRYHKPIWITEYSTAGNGITQSGTSSFIRYFLEGLDARDYVERQSFFSFNSATFGGGLYNYSTGELSQSGETYAAYGNPETDYVTGPEVNPRDSEDPTTEAPTETPTETSTVAPTQKPTAAPTVKPTVKPTTKKSVKVKKPAKAKIKKAKYKKKRKISIKLKKVKGAKGYQIRYSDAKNFDGYWQKNTKKTKITLKKLDKNTKYYIKVRAYKIVNGGKLYGKWSKKKKVKVKK